MSQSTSCSKCKKKGVVFVFDDVYCEKHGVEKKDEVQHKLKVLEEETSKAKDEYRQLCHKYGGTSYKELEKEHAQEKKEDPISKEELETVYEAKQKLQRRREELNCTRKYHKLLERELQEKYK